MRLVGEADWRLVQPPGALDPDVVRAVDHDLRHRVIGEQALEWAVPEDVVGQLLGEQLTVLLGEAWLA